jgi:Flp pilus assembly pilin Flp
MMPERKIEMQNKLIRFYSDESGAVTVDWVVLTGSIVGLGLLVLTPIAFSVDASTTDVADAISNQPVGYTSTP